MGLSVYSFAGVNQPIITCDACGEPIKDIRLAIIAFNKLSGKPIILAKGIFHKGECDPGNKVYPYNDELAHYLRHLVFNLQLGQIIVNGSKRQLVINYLEPNGLTEVINKLPRQLK